MRHPNYINPMASYGVTGSDTVAEISKNFDGECSLTKFYHSVPDVAWWQIEFPQPKNVTRLIWLHDMQHNHYSPASKIRLNQVSGPPFSGTQFTFISGSLAQHTFTIFELNPPEFGKTVSVESNGANFISACEIWIE